MDTVRIGKIIVYIGLGTVHRFRHPLGVLEGILIDKRGWL